MSRCGCNEACACVVSGGDCITVGGTGNASAPYLVSVDIDPDLANQVSCGVPGLYVPPASIEVADTDCINLSGTGFPGDPLMADPTISVDASNILECVAAPSPNAGLRALITVADSDCLDLSGAGTVASPLTADIIVSPDADNTFECRVNGAYVAPVGVGPMSRATIDMAAAQVLAASAGAGIPSNAPILYDTAVEDTDLFIDISTGSMRFIIPAGLGGYYLIGMTERDDAGGTNLNTSVGIQIQVNGVVQASQRIERVFATQKILYTARQMVLAVGDIVEGYFNIVDNAGATAPHPIGPGGAGFPRFLQIVRLSPA